MSIQSRNYSKLLPFLLGAAICATAAAAELQLAVFDGEIRNQTTQSAYQLVVEMANPIYSTIVALPLNRYQVLDNEVGGSRITFSSSLLPVLPNRVLRAFWIVNRAAPSNILWYQWADRRGTPIGGRIVALTFQTDAGGVISVTNTSGVALSYTNLLGGRGVQVTGLPADTLNPNESKVVATITATAGQFIDLSMQDENCGPIYYYPKK